MTPNQELSALMEQARRGSQDAARALHDLYGEHILRVVRRKLDRKLRAQVDSADLAQAVWASFFVNPSHEFQFRRPEELIAFLARLAHNKLVDLIRQRYGAQKFNVNRERPLEGSALHRAMQVADPEPTPPEIAVARERWRRLVAECPPGYERALDLLLQGRTHEEVARELGVCEKTVRRLLRRIEPGSALP